MPKNIAVEWSVLVTLAGMGLAAAFIVYAERHAAGERRRVYGIGLIVAAVIYLVFSVLTQNILWILIETFGALLFTVFVYLAFKYSYWFLVMGWSIHMVWDGALHAAEVAPYVPQWYPPVCVGFDLVIALFIARLCMSARSGVS